VVVAKPARDGLLTTSRMRSLRFGMVGSPF
jgi:hypothetical protein